MLDDGNLSQFDSAGNVIWSTDTENARGGKGKGNYRRTASIDVRLQNVTSEQVVWKPPVGVEVHIQSSPGRNLQDTGTNYDKQKWVKIGSEGTPSLSIALDGRQEWMLHPDPEGDSLTFFIQSRTGVFLENRPRLLGSKVGLHHDRAGYQKFRVYSQGDGKWWIQSRRDQQFLEDRNSKLGFS